MKPWLVLAAAVLVAAVGLGWMSATLLRLDRGSAVSENSRLALWRMDLALARLVSEESARPPRDYLAGSQALGGGPPHGVVIHFDVAPGGFVSTPQQALADRLDPLRAALLPAARPVAVAGALENGRNAGEFNRRNTFIQANLAPPAENEEPEAAMAPTWYGDALVLVRRVRLGDGVHLQGLQLDWQVLRPALLGEVKDLLPAAQLEPVKSAERGDALMLASIPVRLIPGSVTFVDPERTPISWVLAAAWGSLVVLALALGSLLFGAMALDARRAAFVSAVTHELRTPLTTFKLYAEMLEGGMVPAEKQGEYLATLRQEANRLGYLVENVLAYAQIEKGRVRKPLEVLPVAQLLERVLPRLEARAGALTVAALPAVTVSADRVSVEQVLFNLVDNACRYGKAPVALGCEVRGSKLVISISDAGPGVAPAVARKLFEPLRKSAAEAADGAQGIGLGLALSRRLARAMGGELVYRAPATFELSLVTRA